MADEQTTQDVYADTEKIAQRVRERFTWAAWRNILFYQGTQHIEHDRLSQTGWRPARWPQGMPKPVTNRFARVMDAHISMLARFEPSLTFAPGSQDAEDRASADVATRAIEVIGEEVELTTHRQHLAKWVGLTGGAWRETGYDPDMVHGVVDVLVNACAACGYMEPPSEQPMEAPMAPMAPLEPEMDPNTGMALPETGPMPAIDPIMAMGGPPCPQCGTAMTEQTAQMPRGKLYVDAVSLFEMFFDSSIPEWPKQPGCLRQKAVSVDKAKTRWKQYVSEDAIRADSMGGAGQDYMASLATLGPQIDETGRPMPLAGRGTNTKVTENYYYELPCEDYPEGLLVVMLGKKPETFVKAGPLPYAYDNEDGSRTPFIPFVFFPQNEVPGTAWPKTVANDIAPKQAQRNNYEAYVMAWAKRMANAVWVIGQGSNVRNLTGQMGQIIEWNTTLGAHGKPQRESGQPITPGIVEMMARIDHEMDEIAIVSEVMSGQRPAGISAGIALQILKERGETQFGPMFVKWNHAEAQWAKQALAIAKQFWTEARLRKIKGRDGEWEVQKFLGSDLRAGIDVVPEAGISLPRSTMTERAELEQLATLGVLQPAANFEDKRSFLKAYGKLHLVQAMEKETRNTIVENEGFEAMAAHPAMQRLPADNFRLTIQQGMMAGMTPPMILAEAERFFSQIGVPVPKFRAAIDDHAVQGAEHRNFAREQGFKRLPEIVQAFVELHIAAHDFQHGQTMMAAAGLQRGTNPGGGFLAPPGPQPGSAPSTTASQGASSMNGMQGQQREMENKAGTPLG
jgi:hypothetical protein